MISITATTQTYGAYGERSGSPVRSRSAFAGEVLEAATGWYMLGDRPYSPTLRRFIGPDRASPFDRGGVNRYGYCGGDPINRIDPSGYTWLRWLGASQGLIESPGAARSVTPASQGTDAAATTPSTMTSTAAAMTDAVSITAAIDSVALMTSGRPKSGGLFGWIAMGTKATSGGSALPAPRTGAPQARFLGQQSAIARPMPAAARPRRQVTLVEGFEIPAGRLKTSPSTGRASLTMNWADLAHARNPASSIIAADTEITGNDLAEVINLLAKAQIEKATVYSGNHGAPLGDNWNRAGERFGSESTFFAEDIRFAVMFAKKVGVKLRVLNLTYLKRQQFEAHLLEDGVHIIAHCFGVADVVVMESLNLFQVTVYDNPLP